MLWSNCHGQVYLLKYSTSRFDKVLKQQEKEEKEHCKIIPSKQYICKSKLVKATVIKEKVPQARLVFTRKRDTVKYHAILTSRKNNKNMGDEAKNLPLFIG